MPVPRSRSRSLPPGSPRALGYRMPAEWEPHRATWLVWPHERSDWPGKFPAIPWVFAEIVRCVTKGEAAEIVVQGSRALREARTMLEHSDVPMDRVRFHTWRTDRSWIRDSGPTFLTRKPAVDGLPARGVVHWQFNAWARYDNWASDRHLPEHIAARLRLPRWCPTVRKKWVVLEGGAIDVNGRGALLATEECLLRSPQARNPELTRAELERAFSEQLRVTEVVWLPGGIAGDDTHGHVDDVARFVGLDTVVAVTPSGPGDPNARILSRNLAALRKRRTLGGRHLKVVELPSPAPVRFHGRVLPASYANFYITNRAVLVPTFNDPADPEAIDILSQLFPQRIVVGIGARDLVWGLGTLHCLTQQEPATA